MKYRDIALMEAYHNLRNSVPDTEFMGQQYKPSGRPFTDAELAKFNEAYNAEIARLEKRMVARNIDFIPVAI